MKEKEYAKKRAAAAVWMYQRKDRPVEWWRWQVLTKHNTDKETLGFEEKTAFLIFAYLVQDGLLVPTVALDGRGAFAINPGKDAEWKRMMSPFRYWVAHHTWQIFFWSIGVIGGFVVGFGLEFWRDKILGN